MMSIISFALGVYSLLNLPHEISLPLIMLLPFIVALLSFLFMREEAISLKQLVLLIGCYVGVMMFSHPHLVDQKIN